jgi:IS30 family transposase
MSNKKYNQKHLTMTERIWIEKGLNDGEAFASIARRVSKHPTTIAKEIKRNRFFPPLKERKSPLPCDRKKECQIRFLCDNKDCFKLCKVCYTPGRDTQYCSDICPDYLIKYCSYVSKSPYVCNGCQKIKRCNLHHAFYSAQQADTNYQNLLVSSRDGINQSSADIAMLDGLISPLIKKGQSIAHIYAHHGHEIPCSRRTLYNYIDKGVFEAKNIDLRRRVRYKFKERKRPTRVSLSAREFRMGRTYEDFQAFMKQNPSTSVVEMDTVVGGLTNSTQVFLTMLFRNCSLMLIFPLREKSQICVTEVYDYLSNSLGVTIFKKLFPVILTDNGTEFQFPARLECDEAGAIRTKIFFCNPNCSWQKGMLEKNHEYIRYVIPKGQSLDSYSWEDAQLLMNHINSEARDSLNGRNPFQLSLMLLDNKLHKLLGLKEIPSDEVQLRPSLLK